MLKIIEELATMAEYLEERAGYFDDLLDLVPDTDMKEFRLCERRHEAISRAFRHVEQARIALEKDLWPGE